MVRLKDQTYFPGKISCIFQFLMVRLKELLHQKFPDHPTFQFLMVRLKEKTPVYQAYRFFISIPYGSIKRIILFC